jgi:arylsulfatase A-like enzyme
LVVVAAWLGIVTGFAELGLMHLYKNVVDSTAVSTLHLNQHAFWMVPVSTALIFLACALVFAIAASVIRSRFVVAAGFLWLCFMSLFTMISIYRGLTTLACVAFSCGLSYRLGPWLLARVRKNERKIAASLVGLLVLLAVLYAQKRGHASADRALVPPPPASTPNVLLIVLDTVRAESLSLYGYERETSPQLSALAARGVRFDHARSAGAWTLPGHASMFTGRWPHELVVRPDRPLDGTYPTLAEVLRDHGYETAGFVGNTFFCSVWYGLSRGFSSYEDVGVTFLETFRSSALGRFLVKKVDPSTCAGDRPKAYFHRKDAPTNSADFFNWIDDRPKDRPFFAFLNYFDAHDPYLTPTRVAKHFGKEPASPRDLETLRDWHRVDKPKLSRETIELARDSYDDCIAYLDAQLGKLFDGLETRGLLKNTVVVVTADHGELFGEHGAFGHGQELYRQVVRVPLLIVAPDRAPAGAVVTTPVSVRDLPATITELVGLTSQSPFPGRSLARLWSDSTGAAPAGEDGMLLSETADETGELRVGSKATRALLEDGFLYIRNKSGREELYNHHTDVDENHDLAKDQAHESRLTRFRARMAEVDRVAAAAEARVTAK